ncbi:MAG TPA: MauE/DoxX family redox-associated membrane protein [Polyangiaceae bacterium]|nr:MauE/DoxX family redox-associated membrane protein [Polyangiaceae bacterium]
MSATARPTDSELAHATLRLFLGVSIGTHGLARVAHTGAFADELTRQFATTWLPSFSVQAFGYVVPPAELLIGVLIALGLFLRPALVAGTLLMTALTFGTCLRQQWEVAGFQLLYALAYTWLLARAGDARFTVDGLRGA